jgi:hypothetical protein
MAKETEFVRYLDFIKLHFPQTIWLQKENRIHKLSVVHSSTYDNLLLYEVFLEWNKTKSFPGYIRFLDDYKEYINSILIALPVNHPGFIGFLIRSASESLIKYIFSFCYPDITEQKVAKTPFRHLKDDIKKIYKTKPIYQNIIDLLNLYGKYSKEIHLHITNNDNSYGTINYYTNNYFQSQNENIKDVIVLVNLFTVVISFTYDFSMHENTFASVKRLQRNLEKKRLALIQK